MITPYHPQSQGACERANRTIISELAKSKLSGTKDWHEELPFLQFALNTTPHSTTKVTPYFALHGFHPNIPLHQLVPSNNQKMSISDYIAKLNTRYTDMEAIREQAKTQQQKQKHQYDKKQKFVPYNPGDEVWESLPRNHDQKLSPDWQGPSEVTDIKERSDHQTPVNYIVKDSLGNVRTKHHNQLKPFTVPKENIPSHLQTTSADQQSNLQPNAQHTVEDLTSHQRMLTRSRALLLGSLAFTCDEGAPNLAHPNNQDQLEGEENHRPDILAHPNAVANHSNTVQLEQNINPNDHLDILAHPNFQLPLNSNLESLESTLVPFW